MRATFRASPILRESSSPRDHSGRGLMRPMAAFASDRPAFLIRLDATSRKDPPTPWSRSERATSIAPNEQTVRQVAASVMNHVRPDEGLAERAFGP